MEHQIKIVGLGGSLKKPSTSLQALELALSGARGAGAHTVTLDVKELDLPMYVPDMEAPAAARRLAEAIQKADGLIWSSPLYHGTISGSFKNAIDWLELLHDQKPPYLSDKVVGLISTAGGAQGLQAVNTMEFAVRAMRGWAVPLVVSIHRAWQAFDEEGQAPDPKLAGQLRGLGAEVVRVAARFRHGGMPVL